MAIKKPSLISVEQSRQGGRSILNQGRHYNSIPIPSGTNFIQNFVFHQFSLRADDKPTVPFVYGAIAFYLRNKQEIDEYLAGQETKWQKLAAESELQHGPLLERLRNSRRPSAKE